MSEERIVQLEIVVAEQERTIADLSAELARQGREIDEMKKGMEILARRLVEVEDASAPAIPVQKPPHW